MAKRKRRSLERGSKQDKKEVQRNSLDVLSVPSHVKKKLGPQVVKNF